MSKIIAIANQKGGVGKTTTTVNLAGYLAGMGKRVLILDVDPQGNASSGFGIDKKKLKNSSYSVLVGECEAAQAAIHTRIKGLDIIPSNIDLAGAEIELVSLPNREKILKAALAHLRNAYDYMLIDCPPSLGLLTVNALTAADSVLIPIQGEYYALEGLGQLMNTIKLAKKYLNPQLEVEGVNRIIWGAKKPVMTIKSMAAGRCTPYVGLTFSWNAIRPQDMVTLGAFSPQEVEEDVEISLAAIEHRFPDLEKRSSPNQNQAAFG